MGSRETLLLALAIASAFPFLSSTGATETASAADSWDLVVAVDNEILFFKNDTEIRKSTVANINKINALAYDSVNRTLYISDKYDIRSDVVEKNLDSELAFKRLLHRSDSSIWSMVFDPVTKTLFWVQVGAVMKMELASGGIDSSPKISKLHNSRGTLALALDICHRFLYWTTNGGPKGSIERSRLDGSDRKEVLTIDRPWYMFGLTLDHYAGKLYFGYGNKYVTKIEESNLDGTDRRFLVNSDSNKPVPGHLAVDDTAVYYAENSEKAAFWKVYKNGSPMRAINTSSLQVDSIRITSNILTRHTLEGIDCKAVLDKGQNRTTEQPSAESQVVARLDQLSNKMDRLLTNQNQLLLALIGLLEDARLTHTAAISRIDALKPNLLDKAQHQEN